MSWSAARASVLTCALLGCEWSAALPSDPASWSPPRSGTSDGDATDTTEASATIDPACKFALPVFDPTLRTSTATAMSHLPGVACLGSCHAEQGEARVRFAIAGTIYQSQSSREPVATGGTIHGIGGMTLTVDRCGNFYAVRDESTTPDLGTTQPYVENPTVHRMEKLLTQQDNPKLSDLGSCNQADCHDFSTKQNWGVYY